MSRSYDNEGQDRPRSRDYTRRQRSPDYYYAGGGAPPPYASGAIPAPLPAPSSARLQYEPQSPLHNPNGSTPDLDRYSLHVPSSRHRPQSVPPPMAGVMTTSRSRRGSRDGSPAGDGDHPHSPLEKARHALNHTFTPSTSGLGVGVLGAIIGGLAAREVSEATARNREKLSSHQQQQHSIHQQDGDRDRARLVSTLIGAAVGGLGANALEKRLEKGRKDDRDEQEAWERKWGQRGRNDRDDFESDRGRRDNGREQHRRPRYDDRYENDNGDYNYDLAYREERLGNTRGDDGHRSR